MNLPGGDAFAVVMALAGAVLLAAMLLDGCVGG